VVVDLGDEVVTGVFQLMHPVDFSIQLRPGIAHLLAPTGAIIAQRCGQCLKGDSCIRQHLHAIEFQRIAGADVEVEEPHLGVLEQRLRRRGEIGVARADPDDQVGLGGQQVRGQAAGFADPADVQRMAGQHRALARLGFGEGHLEAFGKCLQGRIRPGVLDPAAADDQRLALALEGRHSIADHRLGGRAPVEAMDTFLQEVIRVIPGLGLHVLRQRQGDGTGFGRVGEHAHGVDRRAHQLLGAVDAVPVFAHRTEGVVGADAQVMELLDLLQHRVGLAAGVDIARQ